MKYPKRSQYKYAKSQYRVRNWSEYEAGLKKRGDLTVWIAGDALDAWREAPSGKPGGQRTYSDVAIEAALTMRMVFHLPLRQTEGFLRCLADRLEVDLPIPDHTTLSRRLKKLGEIRVRRLKTGQPIHILIDSTGLRIHVGHVQKPPRNRAWRKLHLAVDAETGEIVASDLTAGQTHDCTQVPALLEQIADPLASVSADGAYDTRAVYEAAHERGEGRAVRVLIPPGRNAQLSRKPAAALQERDRNIRSIRELGRREWHTHSGYSRRSMVENTMYRYKTIIGRSMRSRTFVGQRVEVQLASKILNTMTRLGMPDSYRVA
ncbi:MAG: IS5 family transposase [Gemmatimonadetes bacterium]|nr:IS5 family transposase [Gemmatimonadota bacterium]